MIKLKDRNELLLEVGELESQTTTFSKMNKEFLEEELVKICRDDLNVYVEDNYTNRYDDNVYIELSDNLNFDKFMYILSKIFSSGRTIKSVTYVDIQGNIKKNVPWNAFCQHHCSTHLIDTCQKLKIIIA